LGQITVRDTENSDELDKLNRDVNNMNNLLYSGGIGLDVESVTRDPISRAIQTSVTSIFNIQDAFQTISETDNILNMASSALDVADGVLKIRDGIGTINTVLNPPKKDDADKAAQTSLENEDNPKQEPTENTNNNKQNENTFADTVETTLISLIKINSGIKSIDTSVNNLINMDIQSLYSKDNINSINSFISGMQKIDEGLSKNSYVEKFLDDNHLHYYFDKVYDVNKGLNNANHLNPF
ncbi:MAG: hypothetical protein LBL65_05025, partial [Campylobacteraceae bacterium]|nr:hypothetical protein [Campylobacteraceae bacterium]